MASLKAFLFTFALIFPAELGDKTQIIVLALAARHPWRGVLGGSFLGFAAANVPAALLGLWLGVNLDGPYLNWIAGGFFIVMGIIIWLKREEAGSSAAGPTEKSGFIAALALVFIGEIGDKTQLVTLAQAANYGMFLPVIAGALAALCLDTVIALAVGARLQKYLKPAYLKPAVVVIFLAVGIITLLDVF